MALYGHEIDEESNPMEAGVDFAISFSEEKGDYVGREALLRLKGEIARRLVGIVTEGKRVPRQGYALYDGDGPRGSHLFRRRFPHAGDEHRLGLCEARAGTGRGRSWSSTSAGKRQACTVRPPCPSTRERERRRAPDEEPRCAPTTASTRRHTNG